MVNQFLVKQFLQQRVNLSLPQTSRLTQLLLLAVTILTYNVMAMAIANSLFVSHVGAGNLPLAFIAIGLCSIPAYGAFSLAIDHYSRPKLFRYVLGMAIAIILGLRLLIIRDTFFGYYLLLIIVFFKWDFQNNILYPSLLTDYFTTIEYKRYAPFIGIAQAVGTMVGGGCTILLSRYLKTADLLLCLPALFIIAIAQLIYLESSQRSLDKPKPQPAISILESSKSFPDLVARYPLVIYLASSSFLLVIIYISSEFLWFNIYGQYFDEAALTGFLGLMRIIISLVQVIVLYGVTRPLLKWIGVAQMNPVYPFTTLLSLSGLLFNLNLFSAIGLHINGDALYKAINLPVHQLNYNAIPQEFIGRVRALSDGVIYSLGLTLAGVVLWICHIYLSLPQITWLAASLTLLLLLVRLPMGKIYGQSLEEMIRSDTINLDDFNEELTQLPPQSSQAIRELLQDRDRYVQIKGLELAASIDNPSQFIPEVITILNHQDSDLAAESSLEVLTQGEDRLIQSIVKLFSHNPDPEALSKFASLINSHETEVIRSTALEILIANGYPFAQEQLETLTQDRNTNIATLAKIAAHKSLPDLPASVVKAIARIISYNRDRTLALLLIDTLPLASPDTKKQGLTALASIAQHHDRELAQVAIAELKHPEPLVRVAALQLLAITRCAEMLPQIGMGLSDRDPRVRQQVANTLAAYGKSGLSLAQDNLSATNPEIVNAAIAAIGQVRTKQASDILYKYLTPEFQQVNQTHRWQQQISNTDPNWQPLAVAIQDYQQRLLQKVLYVLSCLGYSRTVSCVNRILITSNRRDLANAVEVLASLSQRRFILPLMPLLEQLVEPELSVSKVKFTAQSLKSKQYQILLEALAAKDPWIRTGAAIALTTVPSALLDDPDPLVRSLVREVVPSSCQLLSFTNSSMNRLLLLKNVPLFKNLSLDELLLIDRALEQQQVLANETIYTEASWDSYLYIIAEGTVRIVKQLEEEKQEIKQLSKGEYFGEVAIFDDAPRWDGAIAVQDCILLKLEKKRFISLIAQRPHIILEICRFLSQRLRETDKYLSPKKRF